MNDYILYVYITSAIISGILLTKKLPQIEEKTRINYVLQGHPERVGHSNMVAAIGVIVTALLPVLNTWLWFAAFISWSIRAGKEK